MTAIDLEGFSQRPTPDLPHVQGERSCPLCPDFTIGDTACRSRQMMFTRAGSAAKVCYSGCSHFDHEAHEKRLATLPTRTETAREEPEEVCPMDSSTQERKHKYENAPPLPAGAKIGPTGRVKLGSNMKRPCPKCNKVWINEPSHACKACMGDLPAKMRQKKAAKKSPEPKLPKAPAETSKPDIPATIPIFVQAEPADVLDHLVEEYAWQLVEKIKVRAAQLLGLECAP